jgi:ubiquinone/menaquinone biosynthesis C-methylase UbiE
MNATLGVARSAAAAAFDRVAKSYDELFTYTAVGCAQRKQVWAKLVSAFPPGSRILELNCGTGEDARFLVKCGCSVVACDASIGMICAARGRSRTEDELAHIEYRHIANEHLAVLADDKPFDGALSNFSGLNCVTDLSAVASSLANLIKPGGRALVCVWSRVCAAEVIWYLLLGQMKKAVRRFSGKATARLGRIVIPVSYPSIPEFRRAFFPHFRLASRRAIGLLVPPSYVEPWISKYPNLLTHLERLDEICAAWPVLCGVGDHVLLEFVRCNP